MQKRPSQTKGISLMETVIVIALGVSLFAMATPVLSTLLFSHELTLTTEQMKATLQFAQDRAITKEQNGKWGVYFAPSPTRTYTLYKGNSYATRDTNFDEVMKIPTQVSFLGSRDIVFDSVGRPTSIATVVISRPYSVQKIISITSQGIIEVN